MDVFVLALTAIVVMSLVVVFARARRAKVCPACRAPRLAGDPTQRRFQQRIQNVPATEDFIEAFRCEACGEEFRQRGNGPIVPRAVFDAYPDGDFPAARVHRQK